MIVRRVEALGKLLDTEDGKNLLAGYRRAANILRAEEKKDGAGGLRRQACSSQHARSASGKVPRRRRRLRRRGRPPASRRRGFRSHASLGYFTRACRRLLPRRDGQRPRTLRHALTGCDCSTNCARRCTLWPTSPRSRDKPLLKNPPAAHKYGGALLGARFREIGPWR